MNLKKAFIGLTGLALAVSINMSCASKPVVLPPLPVPKPVVIAEPSFPMEPYHYSMQEEMQKSYELADEIIMADYAASLDGEEIIYYFDDFKMFNKQTMSWGPLNDVLIPVYSKKFKPEIILDNEFNNLSEIDKVGICWDSFEGKRFIYLVGGQQHLLFLQNNFNEATMNNERNLIDTYPVTETCNADQVFERMLSDYAAIK